MKVLRIVGRRRVIFVDQNGKPLDFRCPPEMRDELRKLDTNNIIDTDWETQTDIPLHVLNLSEAWRFGTELK